METCGCCLGLTLKTGVTIIAVLDCINMLGVLVAMFYLDAIPQSLMTLTLIDILYKLTVGVVALLSIKAVNEQRPGTLHLYWILKLACIPWSIFGVFVAFRAFPELNTPDTIARLGLQVLVQAFIVLWEAYALWSTDQQLKNGQGVLVHHGKAAALESDQASPHSHVYIAVGQAVK